MRKKTFYYIGSDNQEYKAIIFDDGTIFTYYLYVKSIFIWKALKRDDLLIVLPKDGSVENAFHRNVEELILENEKRKLYKEEREALWRGIN